MARHIVFVVSSRPARLDIRQVAVRAAGYWPLPAPTIARALFLAAKVRPSLVLVDPDLSDGRAVMLIEALRAIPALMDVCVAVLGEVAPAERDVLARDPFVHLRPVPNSVGLRALLVSLLEARDGGHDIEAATVAPSL